MLCFITILRMRGEGSAPLLFKAADLPSSLGLPYGAAEPILRLPTQHARTARVGDPGFAETVSKHFAVRVARLRMARREGRDRYLRHV